MQEKIHVTPRSGFKVYDPATRGFLPESGAVVPRNQYWLRRARDGDVTINEPKPPPRSRASRARKED